MAAAITDEPLDPLRSRNLRPTSPSSLGSSDDPQPPNDSSSVSYGAAAVSISSNASPFEPKFGRGVDGSGASSSRLDTKISPLHSGDLRGQPSTRLQLEGVVNSDKAADDYVGGEASTGDNVDLDEHRPVFGTPQVGVIGKHRPREILRIDRDYSGGETCQFSSIWPVELEGRVDPTQYANTLNDLNAILLSAHDPRKSVFDNTITVMTLYLVWVAGYKSHYEREMAKFDAVINHVNREVYNPVGLNILDPRVTGYLYLEIEYY